MKPGDLILCKFQPKTAGWIEGEGCIDMKHHIKGEYGMIVEQRLDIDHHTILFPKFGYEHTLSSCAFEVISENR